MSDAAAREIRDLLKSLKAWRAQRAALDADCAQMDTGEIGSRIREIERRLAELGHKPEPQGKPADTDGDGAP